MSIEKTTEERESTHGSFEKRTKMAGAIKTIVHNSPNWAKMSPAKQEALDMIILKMSRICHGNCDTIDSWHDI